MKIAVNTRLLIKNKLEGIGWFTYENLKRITQQHPEHQFYFIFDRDYSEDFIFADNVQAVVVPPQARHPVLYYLWFNYSVTHILKKIKPDIFFSPDGYLSLRTKVPSMVVFHDLNFEHYPEDLPWAERKYYRTFFPKYARKATRIATVSEYSKSDIVKLYGISPEKIDVVYNGANETFSPVQQSEITETRKKFSCGCPYFVFVGSLHPRKNLARLFVAFDLFKQKNNNDIKLLVVGEKKWWTEKIRLTYEEMEHKNEVIFTGRLSNQNLHKIIASALAITYVSYFEGFGIPIVEAFYCDTPVITSNVTSMPEVAGDAALLVDPFSVESIAEGMLKISQDSQFRKKLIENGRERRKIFSWQKTSERLWKSIEQVLEQGA